MDRKSNMLLGQLYRILLGTFGGVSHHLLVSAVMRDVLECQVERLVSREVLTKRCYVLVTKY
jgi:hypothetical protein